MCGILGVVAKSQVNQLLYDGLQVLQHRGQDAAGIATAYGERFFMHKGGGLVRDAFRTRNMRGLMGHWGIAHVRYPTAGSAGHISEAQPFYVNSPFGLALAHNGNLTNTDELKHEIFVSDLRHVNTDSDSEVLLNVLAHELQAAAKGLKLDEEAVFKAVEGVHRRCRGSYAVVAMIAGYGVLAFRDPNGIRPLVLGKNQTQDGAEWLVSSESVALDVLGFKLFRDIEPGEAVLIHESGRMSSQQCAQVTQCAPCVFEYVYLARPDSIMDGVSVYEARLKMGEFLADKVKRTLPHLEIDTIIPVPDSARPAAMAMAKKLGIAYREGFVKNRYIGRTFIMPGQATRKKSVRQKLNAINQEFQGKNVMIVDDSVVRGTTSQEIISMAREAGARKVYFASAAPPVRFANVYGIDMPTREELIAAYRDENEVCKLLGADVLIYQDLEDLKRAIKSVNPEITRFEASCFDGHYITGDITPDYLAEVEHTRHKAAKARPHMNDYQLDLNLETEEEDEA